MFSCFGGINIYCSSINTSIYSFKRRYLDHRSSYFDQWSTHSEILRCQTLALNLFSDLSFKYLFKGINPN